MLVHLAPFVKNYNDSAQFGYFCPEKKSKNRPDIGPSILNSNSLEKS